VNAARLVSYIEMAVPFLIWLACCIGWLIFRKKPAALRRPWRLWFVVAAVVCLQLIIAHNIYMRGFNHGSAGQPRDEAYLSFFHTSSYIAEDFHVYDNPFSELLEILALNAAFLWLLGRERRETAEQ
jgi:amino acid transporter